MTRDTHTLAYGRLLQQEQYAYAPGERVAPPALEVQPRTLRRLPATHVRVPLAPPYSSLPAGLSDFLVRNTYILPLSFSLAPLYSRITTPSADLCRNTSSSGYAPRFFFFAASVGCSSNLVHLPCWRVFANHPTSRITAFLFFVFRKHLRLSSASNSPACIRLAGVTYISDRQFPNRSQPRRKLVYSLSSVWLPTTLSMVPVACEQRWPVAAAGPRAFPC